VRKLILLGVLVVVSRPVVAQQRWHPEIGVQGGYARVKPAGTGLSSDYADLLEFPSPGYLVPLLSYGPLFAIIPWSNRFAVEPTLGLAQLQIGTDVTPMRLGLRGNYAFTEHLYGGLGPVLNYFSSGNSQFQLGAQLGVGYRFGLAPRLAGRVEASWISTRPNPNVGATNAYALLFGVSARLDGAAPNRSAPRSVDRAWQPVLGMTGGYASAHLVGGGSISGVILPGFGGSLPSVTGGALALTQPPTVFAVIPIGRRLALEPGLDIHRVQTSGQTVFSGNLGARLNFAVHAGWYAAVGGQLTYLKATQGTFVDPNRGSVSVAGATLAWGYRFHVAGQVGGRTELNYSMYAKNTDIPIPPVNVTSILFGLTMPLK
jgi:hypothetical protein